MLAACLLLGVIAIYAVPNLFTPAFQNSDYPDAGIENSSLDGDPSGYSPAHEEQPTDGIEIGEQDPAVQAQKIEDLPGVPDPDEGNSVEADTVISSYGGMEACYKTPIRILVSIPFLYKMLWRNMGIRFYTRWLWMFLVMIVSLRAMMRPYEVK